MFSIFSFISRFSSDVGSLHLKEIALAFLMMQACWWRILLFSFTLKNIFHCAFFTSILEGFSVSYKILGWQGFLFSVITLKIPFIVFWLYCDKNSTLICIILLHVMYPFFLAASKIFLYFSFSAILLWCT